LPSRMTGSGMRESVVRKSSHTNKDPRDPEWGSGVDGLLATMHGGINAALNILVGGMKALGMEAELPRRIRALSFLATPSRVKPITPAKKSGVTGGAR